MISAFVLLGEHYPECVAAADSSFNAAARPCISLCAAGGKALRRWIQSPIALRRIKRAMAALATATVLLPWI